VADRSQHEHDDHAEATTAKKGKKVLALRGAIDMNTSSWGRGGRYTILGRNGTDKSKINTAARAVATDPQVRRIGFRRLSPLSPFIRCYF
jgi:hypothetical protein